jgi:two-component system sensor histidine kinase YesM
MEQSEMKEKISNMEYNMNKSYNQIVANVDSINMSTQFFLTDQSLVDYLNTIKNKEKMSTDELMHFYKTNIAYMERIVNNNPYLYQIRVYADSMIMKEMMPILYRKERMVQLSWASDEKITGWKYSYKDTIFENASINQNKLLMSYVTTIDDYDNGEIGVLEVAMYMDKMFPCLYDTNDNGLYCFVDERGIQYYGEPEAKKKGLYFQEVMKRIGKHAESANVKYLEIDGKAYVAGSVELKAQSGNLVCLEDISGDIGRIHNFRNVFMLLLIVILILLYVFINFIVKSLLYKFYEILSSIRDVQKGNLDVVIENCGTDEMGELGSQINKMLARIKLLMEDNLNRGLLVKNSEIKVLQNQINAHFIYNVLESIKMMAEINEEYTISDAITSLGKLLRYSMKQVSQTVTVADEIDYIKNYLSLINLRFDYEIYLSLNIPEVIYKQQIPKMSLQPIVENAIYHGIEQMAEDTNIYIKGVVEDKYCMIEITDAGRGMTEEEISSLRKRLSGDIDTMAGAGNGIGLKNVQDRIKMTFGDSYGIEIQSKLGCFTKIKVRIPFKNKYEV